MRRITADGDTLMRQAPMTVDLYLTEAIESIDKRLGKGYAKQHPELVAAFLTACAADFATTIIAQTLSELDLSGVVVTEDDGEA